MRVPSDSECLTCIYSNSLEWWAGLLIISFVLYILDVYWLIAMVPLFLIVIYYTYLKSRRFAGYKEEGLLYAKWAFLPLTVLALVLGLSFHYSMAFIFIISLTIFAVVFLYLLVRNIKNCKININKITNMMLCYSSDNDDKNIKAAMRYSPMLRSTQFYIFFVITGYMAIYFYYGIGAYTMAFAVVSILIYYLLFIRKMYLKGRVD